MRREQTAGESAAAPTVIFTIASPQTLSFSSNGVNRKTPDHGDAALTGDEAHRPPPLPAHGITEIPIGCFRFRNRHGNRYAGTDNFAAGVNLRQSTTRDFNAAAAVPADLYALIKTRR